MDDGAVIDIVAGIDEVGRGAVAGPVVAGACILSCDLYRRRHRRKRWSPYKRIPPCDCLIADSKQLTPQERAVSYEWIVAHCVTGIGIVEADDIESDGILAATQLAMLRAVEDLSNRQQPTLLLVDGRDHFQFPHPHRSIIRGDESEPAIAAASIVAKVTRDRLMAAYRTFYPVYGFEHHKGYGTRDHLRHIRRHGCCPLHRLSFLRRVLEKRQTAQSSAMESCILS
jgi:ribonuclease HII